MEFSQRAETGGTVLGMAAWLRQHLSLPDLGLGSSSWWSWLTAFSNAAQGREAGSFSQSPVRQLGCMLPSFSVVITREAADARGRVLEVHWSLRYLLG